jgi:CRP-like cAMP-binding protein
MPYPVKIYGAKTTFGEFYVMNNEPSEFLYVALTDITTYFIRKRNLLEILNKFPEHASQFKLKVMTDYKKFVRTPVKEQKEKI